VLFSIRAHVSIFQAPGLLVPLPVLRLPRCLRRAQPFASSASVLAMRTYIAPACLVPPPLPPPSPPHSLTTATPQLHHSYTTQPPHRRRHINGLHNVTRPTHTTRLLLDALPRLLVLTLPLGCTLGGTLCAPYGYTMGGREGRGEGSVNRRGRGQGALTRLYTLQWGMTRERWGLLGRGREEKGGLRSGRKRQGRGKGGRVAGGGGAARAMEHAHARAYMPWPYLPSRRPPP
jgi:hypothetical protein